MHDKLSGEPATGFDRTTQDIGNIVEFGHVNLGVPDQALAIVFYVMGIGLTRDPYLRTGVDNAWINVGTSQFHLPVRAAQCWRGVIGLVMPDLDALVARLHSIDARLRGTRFAFSRDGAQVDLRCPWGNRIRVHAADAARFGAMQLGMPWVQVDCRPGSAARIGRFYAQIVGALVSEGKDAKGRFVRVAAGVDACLLFRESARPSAPDDGCHLQISVADFSGVHRRLHERGLVSEESNVSQYRFERIVDPGSGELLLTLGHEVRSMRHPLYGRVLVNRTV